MFTFREWQRAHVPLTPSEHDTSLVAFVCIDCRRRWARSLPRRGHMTDSSKAMAQSAWKKRTQRQCPVRSRDVSCLASPRWVRSLRCCLLGRRVGRREGWVRGGKEMYAAEGTQRAGGACWSPSQGRQPLRWAGVCTWWKKRVACCRAEHTTLGFGLVSTISRSVANEEHAYFLLHSHPRRSLLSLATYA